MSPAVPDLIDMNFNDSSFLRRCFHVETPRSPEKPDANDTSLCLLTFTKPCSLQRHQSSKYVLATGLPLPAIKSAIAPIKGMVRGILVYPLVLALSLTSQYFRPSCSGKSLTCIEDCLSLLRCTAVLLLTFITILSLL